MESSTRDRIRDIAINLFSLRGYDAVGVQEIVENSGVTKPTMYYYFKSKSGLLDAILKEKLTDFISQLEKAAEYEHKFFESCEKIIRFVIDFAKQDPDFFHFYISLINAPENSEVNIAFKPYRNQIVSIYFDFFISSAAEFGNMRGKEGLFATLFQSNVTSVAMMAALGNMSDDDKTLWNITHSFIYGFAD